MYALAGSLLLVGNVVIICRIGLFISLEMVGFRFQVSHG